MSHPSPVCYAFGAFRLDPVEKVLFRDDSPVSLTPKTLETLVVLVERHGHVVTKEELLRVVWPDTFVEENNLAQHISTLRRVLGETETGRQFIETIPKRGYRFVGPVTTQASADDATADETAAEIAPPASASSSLAVPATRCPRWAVATGVVIVLTTAVLAAGVALQMRERTAQSSAHGVSAAAGSPSAGPTRIAILP